MRKTGAPCRHPRLLLVLLFVASAGCATMTMGCATMGLRSAVSMKVRQGSGAPASALVYIDGQYIGQLGYVSKKGVRLPEGKHRLSVEKNGYYPYDVIVVSDRHAIDVEVEMLRLPD